MKPVKLFYLCGIKFCVVFLVIITVYAALNGFFFESNESNNFSRFVEIPISKNENLERDHSYMLDMLENENHAANQLNFNDSAQNKYLEKIFFKKIFEIIIHLILSVFIFLIAYEHSYIDLKIDSNDYAIENILGQNNWNKVSVYDMKLIKMSIFFLCYVSL
jgi:hypothetical protein